MKGDEEESGAGNDAPRDDNDHKDGGRLRGLHKRIGSTFRGILEKRGAKEGEVPDKKAVTVKGKEAGDMDESKTGEGESKDEAVKPHEKPAEPQGEEAGKPEEEPVEEKPPADEKEKPPAAGEEKEEEPEKEKEEASSGKADEKHDDKPAEKKKKKKGGRPEAKHGKPGKPGKEAAEDAGKKEEEPKESMSELIAQKDEVEALLSSIEDAYREATLPDNTYQEVKTKNEKKLDVIENKIKALEAAGVKVEEEVKEGIAPEVPAKPPGSGTEAEKPVVVEAPVRPAEAPGTSAPAPRAGGMPSVPVLEDFEKMIGDRMKDVITAASLEMTDKRIRKVDERIDAIESDVKELNKTAETVAGYDKQFTLMNTNVEKTKALVEGIKEAKNITDDKIQRMTESFAEIRSIVYQREAQAKEQEVVFDKLKDAISQVDSARMLREFTTRDEQMRDVNTRLERLERSGKMLSDTMSKIRGLMTDVGSLENIIKASKHVGEKLENIQEIEGRMKATSTRLDGVYVDLKKRLDEFAIYKVKQDKLEGISGDLMKNLEDMTRRLTDYATKDDIELVKQLVSGVKEQMKHATATTVTVELPPEAKSLQEEKEEIETLLSTLEENLSNKEISQEEYDSAKSKNQQKIKEIEEKLQSYSKPAAKRGSGAKASDEEDEKQSKAMLMAKLKESYESGELSRKAYLKSRRMLIKK